MKIMKRITTLLLTVCLVIPCFSLVAHAASGTIVFSDPTTAVGQEVTVDVKVRTTEGAIGDGNVNVTYDASKLEFVNGSNATGGNGTVSLSATGDGTVSELSYTMVFKALAEGTTTIDVSDFKAYLFNDNKLDLTKGNSTVTIGPGDGTTAATQTPAEATAITIKDKKYNISDAFTDLEIPTGFARTTLVYEGVEHQVLKQDASEWYMMYLQGEDGKSEFYLYEQENDAFTPFVQIDLSEENFIMLLNSEAKSTLPDTYKKTVMTINDKEFTSWQDTSNSEYFVVYALSSLGTTGYYQYDKVENTYQRFIMPTVEKDTTSTGTLGKIESFVNEYMSYILIASWGLFILFLIIIIVLGIKLHHRNRELDDLYDEFEDDTEDDYGSKKVTKNSEKNKKLKDDFVIEDLEEDYDDLEEDYDNLEKDYETDDFDLEEDYEMDNFDLEEEIVKSTQAAIRQPEIQGVASKQGQPVRRAKMPSAIEPERRVKKSENRNVDFKRDNEDDFSVDFIDLDD